MIRRIRNIKQIEELKKQNKNQTLLENLVILLIEKGIISKEDYDNINKEKE